jgi:hypothetical protein
MPFDAKGPEWQWEGGGPDRLTVLPLWMLVFELCSAALVLVAAAPTLLLWWLLFR